MMKNTYISILIASALLALSAVSCIYPFAPDTKDGSGALVIEGDILLGEYTVVTLSHTAPVDDPENSANPAVAEVWVEDDAGRTYDGVRDNGQNGVYKVDTRNAPADRKYRLHVVRVRDRREYVSDWGEAPVVPVIDSLSYNLDFDRSRLNVALSMHSQGGSFFKWKYVEKWEFHASYNPELKYEPPDTGWWGTNGDGSIVKMPPPGTYTCFGRDESSEIMIFSTEKQTDDRFVDLEFHPIARNDVKISYVYHIDVYLEPLSAEAYKYWDTVKSNSEYNGNLFAPNPSELVGNIRCVQDPDELVMGYISVAALAHNDLIIRHMDARFYKDTEPYEEPEVVNRGEWYKHYFSGYLPFTYYEVPGDVSQTYWAKARCVDCKRKAQGKDVSYVRPDDWPVY
ncbi:MAG: DUF4249 family protein [Bacteroidales bacterium]|jgi:hypothetical protein|nr:DUF4249 family protein [Bacteroidales bacterium]